MSLARNFLHHPRKLWLRRALFQVHLWAGVLLSLYVIVIGLTGSLLVFEDEFTEMASPRVANYDPAHVAGIPIVLKTAQEALSTSKVFFITVPTAKEPLYRVYMQDAAKHRTILIADPATGAVFPRHGKLWIDWVQDLHIYLLMGDSGLIVNGIGATVLLLLAASGLVLWWPGIRIWMRGLKVSLRHNWRRINFDLHSAVGIWMLVLISWWAISGVYFTWPSQVAHVVHTFSAIEGMRAPMLPEQKPAEAMAPVDPMIEKALQLSGRDSFSGIAIPTDKTDNVIVYVDSRAPGDFSHRDIHYFSQSSGQWLATWHYGQNRTVGDWILWSMHPLHFGTLWGWGPKVLWFLFGMSLPVLSVTGLLMYWNRFLWQRVKRA
ncbi:PepSY domain-containing protein [Acidobacterium sp. S8]|uniref:PepSY-associated TM helix domain-containing protein n=1 Tax=Acidobacterium sp. S8 TaxID=1641854 RepID=UPI00131ABEFC|nr:PepSY-associated TM helix domain-containing protein [Acidobacterium sp. S8]